MTKNVALSANENPLYLFYLPLTCWAWNKFGWKPFVILVKEEYPSVNEKVFQFVVKNINCDKSLFYINAEGDVYHGYKTETIAQLSRLYAALEINDGDYLMSGDADMIPLSDYWQILHIDAPTLWGWDLTNYQHIPICYAGMTKEQWLEMMQLSPWARTYGFSVVSTELRGISNAKSDDKIKRWVIDQDVLTERVTKQWKKEQLHLNHRGVYPNGYPMGRVDRSAWSQNHETYIDCHAPHDILTSKESRDKLLHLLKFIWPNEDFTWWENYQKEFLELIKS